MSDVTRKTDGFHDSVSGRASHILGGMAGGEGRENPGRRPISPLVDGVARLAPRTGRTSRAAELRRAAGLDLQAAILPWFGTEAALVSEAAEDRRNLILNIEAACNAERQRGIARHWTYDVARHQQLISLLNIERAELAALEVSP